jgi:hypothetical protein
VTLGTGTTSTTPEPDKSESFTPYASSFGLEPMIGLSGRLDSPSTGYQLDDKAAFFYGAGAFYSPDRKWSFGLSYQRGSLSSEKGEVNWSGVGDKITRNLQSVLVNVRAYPVRTDRVGMYVGLLLGGAVQTASATGATFTSDVTLPARPFSISTDPSLGMVLGLGLGLDMDVAKDLAVLTSLNLTNYWLTSDSLTSAPDPLIPGLGSAMYLDWRFAFQYRFDTGGGSPAKVKTKVSSASF